MSVTVVGPHHKNRSATLKAVSVTLVEPSAHNRSAALRPDERQTRRGHGNTQHLHTRTLPGPQQAYTSSPSKKTICKAHLPAHLRAAPSAREASCDAQYCSHEVHILLYLLLAYAHTNQIKCKQGQITVLSRQTPWPDGIKRCMNVRGGGCLPEMIKSPETHSMGVAGPQQARSQGQGIRLRRCAAGACAEGRGCGHARPGACVELHTGRRPGKHLIRIHRRTVHLASRRFTRLGAARRLLCLCFPSLLR